jgi:hypothetical protein
LGCLLEISVPVKKRVGIHARDFCSAASALLAVRLLFLLPVLVFAFFVACACFCLFVLIVVSACSDFACSACAVLFFLLLLLCLLFCLPFLIVLLCLSALLAVFFAFFCCLWKFGNKRGFERGSQEIKVKSSGNQHSCKRIFCSAFAALLAVRLLLCLLFLLPVLFVLYLKNSYRNHQINVEFKMKSIGIKEEIKKYKGNSRNQSGIKKIQQIKEGQSGIQKSSNKFKKKTRTWDVWSKKCPKF